MNKNLAIIPARGGSKRIPRKNIKNFLGSPIIKYSIEAALQSGCFDEVMVSTDDQQITAVARLHGANIPFLRSAQNSQDKAILVDVIIEVLSKYKKIGKDFDYICCLLPTAPFITSEQLKKGLKIIKQSGASSVIPVVKFGYPIQRAFEIKNDRLKMIWPENTHKNSQDLIPAYHDSGQFYWLKVDRFLKQKEIFSSDAVAMVLPESEVQDIDNIEDWKIAESKYKFLHKCNTK